MDGLIHERLATVAAYLVVAAYGRIFVLFFSQPPAAASIMQERLARLGSAYIGPVALLVIAMVLELSSLAVLAWHLLHGRRPSVIGVINVAAPFGVFCSLYATYWWFLVGRGVLLHRYLYELGF